ncbi:unnamed protein product [Hymenolepis diminuta]|uniref:Peptidase A2 domain-containing protein n=1 Tax=Hymenolepis diminuta TaxID=6216 RepID=A0A0R3SR55_HYMDI|nr:unnamed protein product [Hymenolepis diminuta]
MRNLIPWMHLHDDFWKYLIVQLLPPRIGLILLRYTSKYSSDQIAHMADILHHKYSAPSDIRPTVIDVISGRTFVIDSGCSISFIPPTANERRTLAPGKWVKMSQGGGLVKYGQKKLTVDFALGYFMPWNFAIMECTEAVIGADFLAYYDLLISTRRKLTKGRVMPNPSYDSSILKFYRSEKTKYIKKFLRKYLEGHETPSEILSLLRCAIPDEVLNLDLLKRFFLSMLPLSFQQILDSRRTFYSINDLALQADKIYRRIYRRNNRVLYITDRISGMEFLVDSGAYLSQIPRNSNSVLEPIPIYRFVKPNGFPIREYGYKYLIVDLGMKETFPWNFLITNNDIPLIAADFLRHFDLCIDLRRRKLIKGEFVNIPK